MTLDVWADLEREFELLAEEAHCASAHEIARDLVSLTLPPENISTVECAGKYRYLPNPEGKGKRLYDPAFTPYMIAPQDALDDPRYRLVVVVGPARTGKSIAGENHLFRRLRHGPLTDTIIYLPGKTDVDSYADKEFADFFTLHPEIGAKLGSRTTDNKRNFKRIDGRALQLFSANPGTVRQKQAPLIMATEIDGYRKALRGSMPELIRIRGRAFGNQFKGYLESHCDAGWTSGIAAAWLETTKGLWYWPCPKCNGWSSPHPLAGKGMHMPMIYDRQDSLGHIEMLELIAHSAGLQCPHCGKLSREPDKRSMLAAGQWVFDGQIISPDGKIAGHPADIDAAGFWIHGTMSPMVSVGELAKEYVGALVYFERTRKPEKLKEVTVKSLGPVYEGAGSGSVALKAQTLKDRHGADGKGANFRSMTIPDGALFATAAIDMGRHKADVKIKGWDLEARSWVIARFTLTANADGNKLDFYHRQEDWLVLRDRVLRLIVPFADDPSIGLPIAGMAIDNRDGHVTHRAREFARQMLLSGESGSNGYRIRLIQGRSSKVAPEVGEGRIINRDDQGKAIDPPVTEFTLNVDKLKVIAVDRLAIDEDGPGYVRWAKDITPDEFTELTNEVLVDGKWERRGPNESLDLEVQNEAVRIKLAPDRPEINWTLKPVWARPVPVPDTEPAAGARIKRPQKHKSIFEKFDDLNRDTA